MKITLRTSKQVVRLQTVKNTLRLSTTQNRLNLSVGSSGVGVSPAVLAAIEASLADRVRGTIRLTSSGVEPVDPAEGDLRVVDDDEPSGLDIDEALALAENPSGENVFVTESAQATAIAAAASSLQPLHPSSGIRSEAFTLAEADDGEIIPCDGTFIVTLPNDATLDLPDGFTAILWNIGAGIITTAVEAGDALTGTPATIPSTKAAAVWKRTSGDWYLTGGNA